ncbi:hypothetical protein [uncultured Vagococcus sp.]|uniref:hypothetical protein n=1 Tax=uncultured Vagococcus sp. TaxID=189676 RepID=UPI00258591F1|nr:hypothetical protein [uncultured Vagococcus sp.]
MIKTVPIDINVEKKIITILLTDLDLMSLSTISIRKKFHIKMLKKRLLTYQDKKEQGKECQTFYSYFTANFSIGDMANSSSISTIHLKILRFMLFRYEALLNLFVVDNFPTEKASSSLEM